MTDAHGEILDRASIAQLREVAPWSTDPGRDAPPPRVPARPLVHCQERDLLGDRALHLHGEFVAELELRGPADSLVHVARLARDAAERELTNHLHDHGCYPIAMEDE